MRSMGDPEDLAVAVTCVTYFTRFFPTLRDACDPQGRTVFDVASAAARVAMEEVTGRQRKVLWVAPDGSVEEGEATARPSGADEMRELTAALEREKATAHKAGAELERERELAAARDAELEKAVAALATEREKTAALLAACAADGDAAGGDAAAQRAQGEIVRLFSKMEAIEDAGARSRAAASRAAGARAARDANALAEKDAQLEQLRGMMSVMAHEATSEGGGGGGGAGGAASIDEQRLGRLHNVFNFYDAEKSGTIEKEQARHSSRAVFVFDSLFVSRLRPGVRISRHRGEAVAAENPS